MIMKISVENSDTPLWRRVAIPESMDYEDLYGTITTVFGIYSEEPYAFLDGQGGILVSGNREGEAFDAECSLGAQVSDFFQTHKTLIFDYQGKPRWHGVITLEKWDKNFNRDYPTVLDYEGDPALNPAGNLVFGKKQKDPVYLEPMSLDEMNEELEWMTMEYTDEPELLLEDGELEEMKEKILEMALPASTKKEVEKMSHADFMKFVKELFLPMQRDYLDGDEEEDLPFEEDIDDLRAELKNHSLMKEEWKSLIDTLDISQCIDFLGILDMDEDEEEETGQILWNEYVRDYRIATEVFHTSKNFKVEIDKETGHQADFLRLFNEKSIRNIGDLLLIPEHSEKDAGELIDTIVETMKQNPELYLYPLERGSFPMLRNMVQSCKAPKKYSEELDNAVATAATVGLLGIRYEIINDQKTAILCFAEEFQHLVKTTPDKRLRTMEKNIEELDDIIGSYMSLYGVIREDEWWDLYHGSFDTDMKQEEFLRFLRLHRLGTGTLDCTEEEGSEYLWLSMEEEDAIPIINMRDALAADVDYYPFRSEEIREFLQDPIISKEEVMTYVHALVHCGIPEEEVPDLVNDQLQMIQIGENPKETFLDLKAEYEEYFTDEQIADILWTYFLDVVMTAPVYALKGYSRARWIQEFGETIPIDKLMNMESVLLEYDENELWIDEHASAPLSDMCWEKQFQYWRIRQQEEETDRRDGYRLFRRQYGDRYGILMMESAEYIVDDPERALALVKRARKIAPEEELDLVDVAIRQIREMMEEPKERSLGDIIDLQNYFPS